uniref:Uncharacterized protein n=1 Tax=Rhabditophanes sp. KR3021 TaxID=114890 RepID=A0AC35TK28_9BILA
MIPYQNLQTLKVVSNCVGFKRYKAVEMRKLNVIGENSKPNSFGFLLNKQIYNANDALRNRAIIKSDFKGCHKYIDSSTYIAHLYAGSGYVTMTGDDWGVIAMVFPNCKDFKELNDHHSTYPFEYLREQNKIYKQNIKNKWQEYQNSQHLN